MFYPETKHPLRLSIKLAASALVLCAAVGPASADKIKHPIAVFSGLDKITGRIISFEVATDETVQFGSLQITERVCYTRPPTEAPQTTTFIEVEEVDAAGGYKKIFSGWMFASSPGLHAIEHPVYDIWLTNCKGGTEIIPSPPDTADAEQVPPPPPPVTAQDKPKPKPRKVQPADDLNGGPVEVGTPPVPPGTVPRGQPSQRYYPTQAQQPQPQPRQQPSFWDSLRNGFQ
ncbi:DUF2155 domain-containing protein [Methyloferula stellata]|uniref:DUF2155 domain-containing protein n=1 Tax=Methyloferula stellata TaxID=876270 RepID=UPI000374FAE1